MALTEYTAKRDLTTTPEPAGGQPSHGELRFVVQKHAASHLHYDFRLELDGVLKSWAVPKGPSLNPADKRLAMMVEDHPMDYRLFEGVIPKGNYGAGKVIVWDEGTYTGLEGHEPRETHKHLKAGLKKGDLKFRLNGTKLKGEFVLVKIKGNERGDNAWLLIKHKDEFATSDDVTQQDRSVLSGATIEDIGRTTRQWLAKPALGLSHTPKTTQPDEVKPMLATLTAEPFDDPSWIYEIKWDGYRILAHVKNGDVRLKTRGGQVYNDRYAPVVHELKNLQVNCVLDGEMVVVDAAGRSNFGALQTYHRTKTGNLVYYVFDVPYADGHDLRGLPLTQRKAIAAEIIKPLYTVKLSDHIAQRGVDFFRIAAAQNLEGIMAKQADSSYRQGKRSRSWLKIKVHLRQEAVIGGFTEPRGSRKRLGALVLGVYDGKQLRYIGHTGGGLTDKQLTDLYTRLHKLERKTSPFSDNFTVNAPVHWVSPKLVCEVRFTEWTADGHMRQPVFEGLREDKPAADVAAETAADPANLPATKAELRNLDKVFWPEEKITKGDLVRYYNSAADLILPYIKDRPESMNRHPNGIAQKNFFHKDLEQHPTWVRTVPIFSESNDKDLHWLICQDRDSLLYMVNLGCIEINPWHSRIDVLDRPDWCLIDLDAKTCGFDAVVTVARAVHQLLEELSIPSLPKTSGKTGLHICIPLGARYTYEQSKQFAQLLVSIVHERLPRLTSIERTPAKRINKIYLDFLQNRQGQTMAAPYCVRPVPGAPVSTPLDWTEVTHGLNPRAFTIKTIHQRIATVGDLWAPIMGMGVNLKAILSKLPE